MRCIRCGRTTYKNSNYCSLCLKKFYLKEYFKYKRKKKGRYVICRTCGTNEKVRPFVGLCSECYDNQRPLRENIRR